MKDLLPLDVACCPDCGGMIAFTGTVADTLLEQAREYECLGGHRGVMSLTLTPHRAHPSDPPREVISPRRYMTRRAA